jgi:uncharacterized SAM-binding protein YcdF (DUF218 family)
MTVLSPLLILALAGMALAGLLVALGYFLKFERLPSSPADAALVFGAGLEWKALARVQHAASLYHRQQVRWLIVSGGVPFPGTGLSEAEYFRRQLMQLGVPSSQILLEERATNTAENAAFAYPILAQHGFRRVILVMSDFEGVRCHLTARRAWWGKGIQVYNSHAPTPGHWSPWGWWLSREGVPFVPLPTVALPVPDRKTGAQPHPGALNCRQAWGSRPCWCSVQFVTTFPRFYGCCYNWASLPKSLVEMSFYP